MARRLFISTGIALAILTGINVLIYFTAKTTQRQQLLKALDHLPPETDCVFLGNSLMLAGGDTAAFKSAWSDPNDPPAPVNLALGATTPVEHYLILKRALQQPLHIKYVIYGFFDDQLNASARGNWSDLVGNRAFSYYFPKDAAAFYAPGSLWEIWKLRFIAHIPMFADRSSFWGKVELLRRWCGGIGMPRQKTDRFGRVADFEELEPANVASFTQRCEAPVRAQNGFSPAVRGIIQLAQSHGAKVILVEMPQPAQHRKAFYSQPAWAELRGYLQSLAARENIIYISASDWVSDDRDFADAMHLNDAGAKLFSDRLAATLSRLSSGGTNGENHFSTATGNFSGQSAENF